ncbi:MAG: agmatine deiminase family protein [Elusimicrobiales bacterium]|nr:agmatine deiminase family protein [Elusimicrobiales bacterium]
MKKNNLLSLLLLAALAPGAYALDLNNPLPNWIDSGREKADGRPPLMAPSRRGAPPSGFRMPAEYEPVGAVVMGWAGYTPMLNGIARAAAGPGKAQLWVVGGPASISGVPAASYSRINAPLDTVWVRDYGPFGIANGRPGIVDSVYRHYQYRRDDDAVPQALGQAKKIDVFGMPIIMDGGNLMVDSQGTLFHTNRTYLWNSNMSREQVDAHLKNYLKVKKIVVFDYAGYPGEPADGTGHIDMYVKLLNDNTVLLAVTENEPFKTACDKAMAWFKANKAPNGQPYKIITVKAWEDYGTWYTYTNSLLVNNVAILPSYSGHPAEEAAAKAAYEAGMPGVTVVPVNSDSSITSGGSIHCVTQTIPVLPALKASEVFTEQPEFMEMDVTPVSPLRDSGDSTTLRQLLENL